MSDADYIAAAAIKAELQIIESLLEPPPPGTPVAPAYDFQTTLPKEPSIRTLAQPALDDANAGWEAVLTARKAALEADFAALGG